MKHLRARHAAFGEICKEKTQDKVFPSSQPAGHLMFLYGVMNLDLVSGRLQSEVSAIFASFSSSWTKDLTDLKVQVEQACGPNWEPFRQTLLSNRAAMDAMCNNQGYQRIGPLSAEIRAHLNLVGKSHADRRGLFLSRGLSSDDFV